MSVCDDNDHMNNLVMFSLSTIVTLHRWNSMVFNNRGGTTGTMCPGISGLEKMQTTISTPFSMALITIALTLVQMQLRFPSTHSAS